MAVFMGAHELSPFWLHTPQRQATPSLPFSRALRGESLVIEWDGGLCCCLGCAALWWPRLGYDPVLVWVIAR